MKLLVIDGELTRVSGDGGDLVAVSSGIGDAHQSCVGLTGGDIAVGVGVSGLFTFIPDGP